MKDKTLKGVGVFITDPQGKNIGYIMVNEKLEVIDNLKNGYHIKRGLNNEWKIKAKKQKK
jgi:hypothetical protein